MNNNHHLTKYKCIPVYYLGHTYIKKFVVYLQFEFNGVSCVLFLVFYSATLPPFFPPICPPILSPPTQGTWLRAYHLQPDPLSALASLSPGSYLPQPLIFAVFSFIFLS